MRQWGMAQHQAEVPVIDISAVSGSASGPLSAVDQACRDHGFFLLTGHGLDDLIDRTWQQAREFFASDRGRKVAIMRDQDNPLGYFDRELTKRRRDHKEVFDFADPATPAAARRNRWPDGPSDFQETMIEFYDAISSLAIRTTALVQQALGLDPSQVVEYRGDRATSSVRLNHYPVGDPVPAAERDGLQALGETALGHHTDPGVITLLLQDDTGGLQTRTADGNWLDVEPHADTIVVNLGDVMQVWTNDRYRAAVHRVVPMTTTDRMSIPHFVNPALDAIVAPIPELAGASPRYSPFTWRSHMQARADDNYTDLGAADTQISDYLVAAT
jgi:isopenicillin N synthase-like dioxygenase